MLEEAQLVQQRQPKQKIKSWFGARATRKSNHSNKEKETGRTKTQNGANGQGERERAGGFVQKRKRSAKENMTTKH